jgi:UV DNA damage endonuclease
MEKASSLALQNAKDLFHLLQYCKNHYVHSFRVGSDFFPRMTDIKYKLEDLQDCTEIKKAFDLAGKYAYDNKILLSCHPGPFTILSSPRSEVNDSGIDEVEMHSLIGSLLCQSVDLDFTINFHINSSYGGDLLGTSKRFIANFKRLSHAAQKRVILENDDKAAGFSTQDYYNYIHQEIGVPLTFDLHHWLFKHNDSSIEDDYNLAKSTWQTGRSNQVHYSQSPTSDKLIPKHSDYYRDPLPQFIINDADCHVHLEAKAKEQALFKYRNDFLLTSVL